MEKMGFVLLDDIQNKGKEAVGYRVEMESLISYCKSSGNLELMEKIQKYQKLCLIDRDANKGTGGDYFLWVNEKAGMYLLEYQYEAYTRKKQDSVDWDEVFFEVLEGTFYGLRAKEIRFGTLFEKERATRKLMYLYTEIMEEVKCTRGEVEKEIKKMLLGIKEGER